MFLAKKSHFWIFLVYTNRKMIDDRMIDFWPKSLDFQSGVLINPLIIPKSQWGVNVSPFYINVENEGVPL